jgi:hypothetical protein
MKSIWQPRTAYCLLPTAYCSLPTALEEPQVRQD